MSMGRLCNPTHTKLPMRNILDGHLIALMKTRYIEQVPWYANRFGIAPFSDRRLCYSRLHAPPLKIPE